MTSALAQDQHAEHHQITAHVWTGITHIRNRFECFGSPHSAQSVVVIGPPALEEGLQWNTHITHTSLGPSLSATYEVRLL